MRVTAVQEQVNLTETESYIYDEILEKYEYTIPTWKIEAIVKKKLYTNRGVNLQEFIEDKAWTLLGNINNGGTIDYLDDHIDWDEFLEKAGIYYVVDSDNNILELDFHY